jgi:glutamate/aspartate transport system substrate-binding protein
LLRDYKVGADGDPVGFSADLCLKVVDAVKAKLGMPNLKVQYVMVTPANRIPLVQNGTVDLECSTTTNTTARAQQVEFAPTHFVGSIAAAVKKNSGIVNMSQPMARRWPPSPAALRSSCCAPTARASRFS